MENVKQVLEQFGVNTSGRSTAVTSIRLLIEAKPEEKQTGFVQAFAYDVFAASVEFTDRTIARLTAQYVVDEVAKADYTIPLDHGPILFAEATAKAERFKNDPNNAWMFASGETESSFRTDSDTPVAPKKQNKTDVATALYILHIKTAESPITNSQFVEMLMKELDTTKSGARTFAYNAKKAAEKTV